jgi:hypothetical protein
VHASRHKPASRGEKRSAKLSQKGPKCEAGLNWQKQIPRFDLDQWQGAMARIKFFMFRNEIRRMP